MRRRVVQVKDGEVHHSSGSTEGLEPASTTQSRSQWVTHTHTHTQRTAKYLPVPCVGTVSTGRLAGGDAKGLGREADRAADSELLADGSADKILRD
jgi:hypothetical protein